MLKRYLTWRTLFITLAISIIGTTIFYSNYLGKKLANEERQRVEEWLLGNTLLQKTNDPNAINLAGTININNEDIPLIAVDSVDNIVDYKNLDTTAMSRDKRYLRQQLASFKSQGHSLEWVVSDSPRLTYRVHYGETRLQRQIKYFPLIQLCIFMLFMALLLNLVQTQHRSTQNQLWAGMAKETAHQLGTPISSLQGWLAMLRDNPTPTGVVEELEKDVYRLNLVSDRFSKIGSKPMLEQADLGRLITEMVDYMKRRSPGQIQFKVLGAETPVMVKISPTLMSWSIENLLKNALDAMNGNGSITIALQSQENQVMVDFKDTGRGIETANWKKIFNPGFSTKKRGWGLGLTLSKRIVEEFHGGKLYVKESETGKGTTFRMILPIGG